MAATPARQGFPTALLGAPRRRWYAFFPALALGTGLLALAPAVLTATPGAPGALVWGWASAGALTIAAAIAVVLDLCDSRLSDVRQVERILQWPVLEELPRISHSAGSPPLAEALGPSAQKTFDRLALRLTRLGQEYEQRAFTLLSATHGEGTSLAAAQLAAALARGGNRVVLIDGDLSAAGSNPDEPGFTDLLAGDPTKDDTRVRRTLVASRPTGLQRLAAGSVPAPAEPDEDPDGTRDRARSIFLELRRLADFVVCDGPTIASGGATVGPLATAADACVLVLEAERMDAETALAIRRRLLEAGARVAGVLLTPKHIHRMERRRATGRRPARPRLPRPAAAHRE